MDYEKAYKEALERARELYDSLIKEGTLSTPKGIEKIFPELCESEDERIRKEIISIVKFYRESCITEGNHRFDDCIAWLEKQGEKSWSEEDEENFNTLSKIICDSQASAKIANKLSDWLKSLKPRWKPTEEQISELGKAAILQNVRFNKSILESLYNELKSL